MSPLLENFIGEARELIEAVGKDLLALESSPGNPEIINSLFRNIHTLKGASGVIDGITPFTQLAHVMEDLLQKVRDGVQTLSNEDIDLLLACLDQLVAWVDDLENDETLPKDASEKSQELQNELNKLLHPDQGNTDIVSTGSNGDATAVPVSSITWMPVLSLEEKNKLDSIDSGTAIYYKPSEQCFFSGDDPLLWMTSLDDIVWRDIIFSPTTDPFDPFICQLEFKVVTSEPIDSVKEKLLPISSQAEFIEIGKSYPTEQQNTSSAKSPQAPAKGHVSDLLMRLVDSQISMLNASFDDPETQTGKMKSALTVYHALSAYLADKLSIETEKDGLDDTKSLLTAFEKLQTSVAENRTSLAPQEPASNARQISDEQLQSQIDSVNKRQIKTLKVDQDKVDLLMDLVGELIVAKNSMQYLARRAETEFGVRKLAQDIKSEQTVISRLSEDLQSVVMDIRMVPLSMVFQRYPRLIRDISRKLGKQVDLIIQGEETEADKNIVEDLAEPLIHVIRNSLDHGLEMPDDRIAAGKSVVGKIVLSAQSKDDSVIITVKDDGKGIDPEIIKRKAVEKGVITEEEAKNLNKHDSLNLIFEAGFSTADQISDLSGRGVGMDSVRSAVERNGGSIDLDSEVGEGTEIKLILPLSMTVSRVMMFDVANQTYGIPVEEVTETLKLDVIHDVKKVKQVDTFVLRGQAIPMVFMSDLLGLPSEIQDPGNVPVLVLRIGEEQMGLAVDKLQEGHDVIIKPLEGTLASYNIYRGAAILGDGRILLILNIEELLNHAY